MPILPMLASRCLTPEIMDQPDLDAARHVQALRGLSRINSISASASVQWRAIEQLMRERGLKTLRVLDVATGGGDIPLRVWRKARRAGLSVDIDACDASPCAVEFACTRAQQRRAGVRFFRLNVLDEPLPQDYDVLTCWLFLHHLRAEQAIELMRRMAAAAHYAIFIDDLRRSPAGMVAAFAGTRLLSRSPVVHEDSLRSVAAAFTMGEVAALARAAGLDGFNMAPHWPFRYLLAWRRT